MPQVRDWQEMKEMYARLLMERTGKDVVYWNQRIKEEGIQDEANLRGWLNRQDVTGYAQTLLVWEQFGYPDWMQSSADNLIEGQYADRPHLRPIYDALIEAAVGVGEIAIQTRKTYVSLVTPRRTFARIQPTRLVDCRIQ